MIGETVTFHIPLYVGIDDLGNEVYETSDVSVDNVLVASGTGFADVGGVLRPVGDECDITLYLPKSAQLVDVRGATVDIPTTAGGRTFKVKGAPFPYPEQLCPTEWSCVVPCDEVLG